MRLKTLRLQRAVKPLAKSVAIGALLFGGWPCLLENMFWRILAIYGCSLVESGTGCTRPRICKLQDYRIINTQSLTL